MTLSDAHANDFLHNLKEAAHYAKIEPEQSNDLTPTVTIEGLTKANEHS